VKRLPTPAGWLIREAARLVIACRAGRRCPSHAELAATLGCSVQAVRVALASLHVGGFLKVEQCAVIGGTRTRMRVAHEDFSWSAWTDWSRLAPYSATTRAMMRTHPPLEASA